MLSFVFPIPILANDPSQEKHREIKRKKGFMEKMRKKTMVGLIAIVVIAVAVMFSGCVEEKPENVVISFAEYMDKGEYEKALDLLVHPDTLEPYSREEKEMYVGLLEMEFGEKGEYIKVEDIKVINKEKIDDDKYVVTVSTKSIEHGESKVETEDFTVVKVDGDWKIATELPALPWIASIAALAVAYLIRRRK